MKKGILLNDNLEIGKTMMGVGDKTFETTANAKIEEKKHLK